VTKVTRAVERKARSAYNAVLSASNRVTAMKKSVEAQQMVVAAKEEGFRSGMLISISVLDATQDLYKYKKEYSQARNDYILDTIRLKQTAGTLSEDDIRQVNALLQ
jgi:outer membrane protein